MAQPEVGRCIKNSCSQILPDEPTDDHNTCQKCRDSENGVGSKREHDEEDNPVTRSAPTPPASSTSHTATTEIMAPTSQEANAPAPSTVLPSLRELAAKKIADSLLQCDDPVYELESMEEHERAMLSPYLWREYNRLRDYEHKHEHSGERFFPHSDKALFTHDGSRIPSPNDEVHSPDIEIRENGYTLRSKFLKRWQYSKEHSSGEDDSTGKDENPPDDSCDSDTDEPGSTSWDNTDLFRKDDRSPFCLCECKDQQSGKYSRERICKKHGQRQFLFQCISSPLLYYRLTAVFGMPPASVADQYKICWEATLYRVGDEGSSIYFSEFKGATRASFSGSAKAGKSALNLLSWLLSDNIPHAYDGILAGSVMRTPLGSNGAIYATLSHDIAAISTEQLDELLSPQFWEEYKQLRDFENDHKPSCNGYYFPDADKALFTHNGSRIPYHDGRTDGTALRRLFLSHWAFYPDNLSHPLAFAQDDGWYESNEVGSKILRWDSDMLHRDDETPKFQFCRTCNKAPDRDDSGCKKHPRSKRRFFHEYISSQLLYYRLTAVFEMPPAVPTDTSKSCWKATLYGSFKGGSCLVFEEDKGRAKVSFKGSSKASKEALELLDWLVSDNVPHTYDGILAGSVA